MDKKAFAVYSNKSIGCTFLEWSVYWLSNHLTYYSWAENKNIDLVSDPLQKINAHGHKKNHPCGFSETTDCLTTITNQNVNDLISCYPCDLGYLDALNINGLDNNLLKTTDGVDLIRRYIEKDRLDLINFLHDQKFQIIYLHIPKKYWIYAESTLRNYDVKYLSKDLNRVKKIYNTDTEYYKEILELYYEESLKQYDEMTDWDLREIMSLSLIPENDNDYKKSFPLEKPHKFIPIENFWNYGDEVMVQVLDFLELSLNYNKLDHWLTIYKKWQKQNFKILNFMYSFDHIVESIVNNWNFDLKQFNLTLRQEAIIQSQLIKQYNLTIKNWQLNKFPDNAKDLHSLLEENFHQIKLQ